MGLRRRCSRSCTLGSYNTSSGWSCTKRVAKAAHSKSSSRAPSSNGAVPRLASRRSAMTRRIRTRDWCVRRMTASGPPRSASAARSGSRSSGNSTSSSVGFHTSRETWAAASAANVSASRPGLSDAAKSPGMRPNTPQSLGAHDSANSRTSRAHASAIARTSGRGSPASNSGGKSGSTGGPSGSAGSSP